MDLFILVVMTVVFSIAVGIWAKNRGRDGIGWFFISFFLSPVLGAVLLMTCKKLNTEPVTASDSAKSSAPAHQPGRGDVVPLGYQLAQVDDEDFAEAQAECVSLGRKPGVWAKAFAQAEGDELKAQALYIGRRATEIGEARADAARAELASTQEGRERLAQEAYEALPKGTCPNCDAVVPLAAEKCKCGANFTARDGWRVLPLKSI